MNYTVEAYETHLFDSVTASKDSVKMGFFRGLSGYEETIVRSMSLSHNVNTSRLPIQTEQLFMGWLATLEFRLYVSCYEYANANGILLLNKQLPITPVRIRPRTNFAVVAHQNSTLPEWEGVEGVLLTVYLTVITYRKPVQPEKTEHA